MSSTEVIWGESGSAGDFRKAFEGINKLTLKAVNTVPTHHGNGKPTGKTKSEFVLDPQAYYDLKTYVVAGKRLPSSKEAFSKYFVTEEAAKRLTDLDPLIYMTIRNVFVRIQNNCNSFNDENLSKIVTIATNVREYAISALDKLSGDPKLSIQAQFNIITDEKYRAGAKDEAYYSAVETVQIQLDTWKAEANGHKKKVEKTREGIETFLGKTQEDKRDADFIHHLFWEGPVVDIKTRQPIKKDGKEIKNYSSFLDDEFARLVQETSDLIAEQEKQLKGRKYGIIVAALMVPVCGPFSILAIVGVASGIPKLNKKLEELAKKQTDLGDEQTQLQRLIGSVKILKTQFDKLMDVMSKALTALDHLQGIFQHQAKHLGDASTACFQALKVLPDSKSFQTRKIFLEAFVRNATKAWKELQAVTEEFIESSKISVEIPA
ncbi:hypothetical protein SI65_09443 [Aspergillus cristatus]|uniref:Uncharacterized protein n=1 Tax=Aspergillus cristatus TaxID=573508 RepID=A0A1E3B2Q7_ASPCR|nr:hypothetical protein SI65_09443 [Aspergillus cristatus]